MCISPSLYPALSLELPPPSPPPPVRTVRTACPQHVSGGGVGRGVAWSATRGHWLTAGRGRGRARRRAIGHCPCTPRGCTGPGTGRAQRNTRTQHCPGPTDLSSQASPHKLSPPGAVFTQSGTRNLRRLSQIWMDVCACCKPEVATGPRHTTQTRGSCVPAASALAVASFCDCEIHFSRIFLVANSVLRIVYLHLFILVYFIGSYGFPILYP